MNLADHFRSESRSYLCEIYPARLQAAMRSLPPQDLWWRPHPDAISFGTILLHLEGNVRQWILSGLGGRPDRRERELEFSTLEGPEGSAMMARLLATTQAAGEVIAGLTDERLLLPLDIQGFETTAFAALTHVVEHFSWHCGQAVWIAKSRAGRGHGLSFFDEDAINAARNAPAPD